MKINNIGRSIAAAAFALTLHSAHASTTATFESIPLDGSGFWNGSDSSGGFYDGAHFNNNFTDWGGGFTSWSGFSVSNHTDTTTSGFENQYSAYPGIGAGGSDQYAVAYRSAFDPAPIVSFGQLTDLTNMGAMMTNTTYSALSILNGESPAKQFTNGDFFLLTLEGFAGGNSTGTVEFYLADYREGKTDLVDDWTWVDFSDLGTADSVVFNFSSSDNDPEFGINTPTYVAIDNMVVPEPSTLLISISGLCLLARRRRSA